ncbi:MAG: glycosyltransferase family 2 protein [Balneolales bacterium]
MFHNKIEWIKPTLRALYAIHRIPCEFIFIDDHSTDGSAETIRSMIEHYQHNQSWYYEQQPARGRGNSINAILEQVHGRFLWIPESLETVDADQLSDTLTALSSSDAVVATDFDGKSNLSVPETGPNSDKTQRLQTISKWSTESATGWLKQIEEGGLPFERNFIFDLEKIQPDQFFIDPHHTSHHAFEWALRLNEFSGPALIVKPFSTGDNSPRILTGYEKSELVLTLLRTSGLSEVVIEQALEMLRSYDYTDRDDYYEDSLPFSASSDNAESSLNTTVAIPVDPDKTPSGTQPESDAQLSEGDPDAESSIPGPNIISPEPEPTTREPEALSDASDEEIHNQPHITIIIPTATNRRPLLEECLTSVFRFTSPGHTQVIVIDNGSVDDTPEYLDQLLRKKLPLTVLTNDQNLGFAAAVNQGLAKAGKGCVVVMHNDVILKNPVPARLAQIIEKNPDIGLVTPKADRTWHRAQLIERIASSHTYADEPQDIDEGSSIRVENHQNHNDLYKEVDFVDGYCMAFRNEPGLTMSKEYGLAYFDDADFCCRLQKKGFRIVVDEQQQVTHYSGQTTGDLGLSMRSKAYWHNAARFHKHWNLEPPFPAEHVEDDPLRQLVLLGNIINLFYPEKHLLDYFHELFTSEQKTRIFHSAFPYDDLKALIRLMMAANQRETLRHLEQQLDSHPPDIQLYHDLIAFYFERTIYSRCKLYLKKLDDNIQAIEIEQPMDSGRFDEHSASGQGTRPDVTELPADFELYRLKIAIGEKDYKWAAELLTKMTERIPTHPEVLLSAAEIHRRNGNRDQSNQFISLAKTFNPYLQT